MSKLDKLITLNEYEAARCTVQGQRLAVVMHDLYEQHGDVIDELLGKLQVLIHDAAQAVNTCYSFVFEDEKMTGVLAFVLLYELVMKGGYGVFYRSVGDYSSASLNVYLYPKVFGDRNDAFGYEKRIEKRIEVCVSAVTSCVQSLTQMVRVAQALGLLE